MSKITIDIENEEDRQFIEVLLKKLGIGNIEELHEPGVTNQLSNGKEVADLMQEIAESGGLSTIEDPVAWQKEVRTDNPIL